MYAIAPDGSGLRDISAGKMPVLEGALGDEGAPMGISLYRRSKDGAIFAIISPKAGPKIGYLWQYRLADDGTGRMGATFVRRFGAFSGVGEIKAIVVDDELGYVSCADETAGIHKWHANPDAPGADYELALFGSTGYQQDREGLGDITISEVARATSFRSISYRARACFHCTGARASRDARTITQPCCCRSQEARTAPTVSR